MKQKLFDKSTKQRIRPSHSVVLKGLKTINPKLSLERAEEKGSPVRVWVVKMDGKPIITRRTLQGIQNWMNSSHQTTRERIAQAGAKPAEEENTN